MTSRRIVTTYLVLTSLQTLAASFIWGVNTLFLLDAGLSLTEAFVANAAFTAGMVIFEVPTGVVADTMGRRTSFILGAVTLLISTLAYLGLWQIQGGIILWILVSALIGLGFTFFTGATEAWLVDALDATGFKGGVDRVFGKGQIVMGAAMLVGTVSGGFLGQVNMALPYLFRSGALVAVIITAFLMMRDIGFTPERNGSVAHEVRTVLKASIEHGIKNPPVRLFMLAALFADGIFIWVFYAFQPYLLELIGDPSVVYVAGIAAATFAVSSMVGGSSVGFFAKRFQRRTSVLLLNIVIAGTGLILVGAADLLPTPSGFWVAVVLLVLVSMFSAVATPMRQAYLNAVIPSKQRATVLSFASLMGSAGGVVAQPVLGRVADVWSLSVGYVVAGVTALVQLPFVLRVRRLALSADETSGKEVEQAQLG
ncbi:MAG TPA: MFS transporter [Acidimicrobiia bacterium]|jgi:MFS family permease